MPDEPKMGRPNGLTSEVVDILCREVRDGAKPNRAVMGAGFSKNCWSNWRRQAEAGEQPYKDAVDAIERSEALCLADAEKVFHGARYTDWKAAEAFLASRAREDYGKRLDVTAKVGELDPTTVPDGQLAAIALGTSGEA